jgi:sRNA-binding protein
MDVVALLENKSTVLYEERVVLARRQLSAAKARNSRE